MVVFIKFTLKIINLLLKKVNFVVTLVFYVPKNECKCAKSSSVMNIFAQTFPQVLKNFKRYFLSLDLHL